MSIKDNPELFGIKRAVKRSRSVYAPDDTYIAFYADGQQVLNLGKNLANKLGGFFGDKVGFGIMNGDSIVLFEDDAATASKISGGTGKRTRKTIAVPKHVKKDIEALSDGRDRLPLDWMQVKIGNETAFKLTPSIEGMRSLFRAVSA